MHLTLKKEATKPAGFNFLQQQEKFDHFMEEYNNERPHQAIGMKYPGELYVPSARVYNGLPDLEYPLHDKTITVTNCGRICLHRKKLILARYLQGKKLASERQKIKFGLYHLCIMI